VQFEADAVGAGTGMHSSFAGVSSDAERILE